MASCICWCGHVLKRDDGHALKRILMFEVDEDEEVARGAGKNEGWC